MPEKEIDYSKFNTISDAQKALEVELNDITKELNYIESEMTHEPRGSVDREMYLKRLKEITHRLDKIADYATDEQYDYIDYLLYSCKKAPEIEYVETDDLHYED